MIEFFTILLALGICTFIAAPLLLRESDPNVEDSIRNSLESRYMQALLDLESDLLGGRISDAEFRKRRETMARMMQSEKGSSDEQSGSRE